MFRDKKSLICGIMYAIFFLIPAFVGIIVIYNKKYEYSAICYQTAIIVYGVLAVYHTFKSIYLLSRNEKTEKFHSSLIRLGFCLVFFVDAVLHILLQY